MSYNPGGEIPRAQRADPEPPAPVVPVELQGTFDSRTIKTLIVMLVTIAGLFGAKWLVDPDDPEVAKKIDRIADGVVMFVALFGGSLAMYFRKHSDKKIAVTPHEKHLLAESKDAKAPVPPLPPDGD